MLSPAMQHTAKAETGQTVCPNPVNPAREGVYYRAHLHKLTADLKRLSSIRSQGRRLAVKREVLNEYRAYCEGLLSGKHSRNGQDTVLVWCAVWSADVGDISNAIHWLAYALNKGMTAPETFSRSLPEAITETVCNTVLEQNPVDYLPDLQKLAGLVTGLDMCDGIHAKLCKARGLALANSDPEQAIHLLEQAQTLRGNIGVRGHLKKLKAGKVMDVNKATLKNFDMPTRQAAKVLGISSPTMTKYAALYPNELPYLCIQAGKHKAFRFCKHDIEQFKQRRIHGLAA